MEIEAIFVQSPLFLLTEHAEFICMYRYTISPTDTDAVQQVLNANPDQAEALQTYFDYKRRYQK